MKKISLMLFLAFLLIPTLTFAKADKHNEFLTSLKPYITKAVSEHYKKDVPNYEVLDATILKTKEKDFVIKVDIGTYYKKHKPPFSIDKITLNVGPKDVKVVNYKHIPLKEAK